MGRNTHWIALCVKNDTVIYFDSFGVVPPLKILRLIKKYSHEIGEIEYMYNKKEIQNINGGYCGEYCILFLYYMQNSDKEKSLIKMQKLFSGDQEKNKTILLKKLHGIGFFV